MYDAACKRRMTGPYLKCQVHGVLGVVGQREAVEQEQLQVGEGPIGQKDLLPLPTVPATGPQHIANLPAAPNG